MRKEYPRSDSGERELETFIDNLRENGWVITTPRTKQGYISRKLSGVVSDYSGRYGEGFTIERPFYHTTGYHSIIYAIMPETAD